MAPLPSEISALDDPKWKGVDDKIKGLLKSGLAKRKFNKKACNNNKLFGFGLLDKLHAKMKNKDSQNSTNEPTSSASAGGSSATKWLLRGPRGACLAAIIPGDSAAESVLTLGLLNFINLYNFVLIVRVLLTWFPNPPGFIIGPVSTLADPYLNLFRGIIPPIGGTIDLSPVLAFLSINVFTNAAEALPCELQSLAEEEEETMRRMTTGRRGKVKRTRRSKQQVAALSKDQLDSKHPTWRNSRMNPVLLLEGLKQARERFSL
jgi:uncharacterized protein YggT (Ycf19 family)